MDGWWNEDENFYPFEETPEEDAQPVEEQNLNPFKPISVAAHFEHQGHKQPAASKAFTPPKPGQPYGQPYGQAFSHMAPLTPARPFSQIQQGDLYGYSTPDEMPATVTSSNPYAPQPDPNGAGFGASPLGAATPNDHSATMISSSPFAPQPDPFGTGFGASPLGAVTPDTLPTNTGRFNATKRSGLHQPQPLRPSTPVWSIDDDPIAPRSAPPDGASSPYPGFPPLPQAPQPVWQPPAADASAPFQLPTADGLDWSLPAYPEADPEWQPSESETTDVPDFLKEPPQPEEPEAASDSPMDKLNIPAYLRVQPLPRKVPKPAPEPEAAPEAEPPKAMPFRGDDASKAAEQAQEKEPAVYTDAVFMRPKDQAGGKSPFQRPESAEDAQAVADAPKNAQPEEAPSKAKPEFYEQISFFSALTMDLPTGSQPADEAASATRTEPEAVAEPVQPVQAVAPASSLFADGGVTEEAADDSATDDAGDRVDDSATDDANGRADGSADDDADSRVDDSAAVDDTIGNADFKAADNATDTAADTTTTTAEPAHPVHTFAPASNSSGDANATEATPSLADKAQAAKQRILWQQETQPETDTGAESATPAEAVAEPAVQPEEQPAQPAEAAFHEASATGAAVLLGATRRSRRSDATAQQNQTTQEAVADADPAQPRRRRRRSERLPETADPASFSPQDAQRPSPYEAATETPVASPFARRGSFAPVYHGTKELDEEDDWRPYVAPLNAAPALEKPLFSATDAPFGNNIPPMAGQETPYTNDWANPTDWSPFDPPADLYSGGSAYPSEDLPSGDAAIPSASPFPVADASLFPMPEPSLFSAPDAPFDNNIPPMAAQADPYAAQNAPYEAPAADDWSPFDSGSEPQIPIPQAPVYPASDDLFDQGPMMFDEPVDDDWFAYGAALGKQGDQAFDSFAIEEEPANPFSDTAKPVLLDTDQLFQDGIDTLKGEYPFGSSGVEAAPEAMVMQEGLPYELIGSYEAIAFTSDGAMSAQAKQSFTPTDDHEDRPPAQENRSPSASAFPGMDKPAAKPQKAAKANKAAKASQTKPAKPPINPVRLFLLLAAIAMALFCIIAGTKMLAGYVQNTEDWSRTHEEFIDQHGISMNQAGEMVSLLQDGSTFAPSGAPVQSALLAAASTAQQPQADPSSAVEEAPTPTPVLRTKLHQYPDNPLRNIIPSIAEIQKEYPEVVGKLVIPNVMEEWIMQRNNTYYLNHNYRGTSAEGGAVFIDAACTLDTPPENLHLRGSSSVEGKTFHPLWQYKTGGTAFVYSAEMAQVTTMYEETKYLLLAIIETSADPSHPNYFNYTSYPTFATDEEMLNYVALARQHSLYNLPTDVQPGDRLLTLSTVSGADEDGTNLVLIFRSER